MGKELTVTGSLFRKFWNDKALWLSSMYVDDASILVDGDQMSTDVVEEIPDTATVSVHTGFFVVDGPVHADHLFAKTFKGKSLLEGGSLDKLLELWVEDNQRQSRSNEDLQTLRAGGMPAMLSYLTQLRPSTGQETVSIDAEVFNEILRQLELQAPNAQEVDQGRPESDRHGP